MALHELGILLPIERQGGPAASERFRLGIIGAGAVVRGWHLPAFPTIPELQVDWVVDRDEGAAEALAANIGVDWYSSVDAAPAVDGVLVAVPAGARSAVVPEVIRRGWHALCEKPFATSVEEHRSFVEAARARRLHLGVGFMRRYYASVMHARDLVAAERFGQLEEIVAGTGSFLRRTGRGTDYYRGSAAASGGEMAETGSHLIDQVFHITRARDYVIESCRQQHLGELEVETHAQGMLRVSERSVPLSLVVTRIRDAWNGVAIKCANAELRLGLMPNEPLTLHGRDGTRIASFDPEGKPTALYDAVREEWEHFLRGCRLAGTDNGRAPAEEETGLLTTAFIAECYEKGSL